MDDYKFEHSFFDSSNNTTKHFLLRDDSCPEDSPTKECWDVFGNLLGAPGLVLVKATVNRMPSENGRTALLTRKRCCGVRTCENRDCHIITLGLSRRSQPKSISCTHILVEITKIDLII